MKGFIIFRNDEVWEADESLLSPEPALIDDRTVWTWFSGPAQRYRWSAENGFEEDEA